MSMDIPKSGYNKFSKFKYHELEDLLPPITSECFDQELILLFDFTDDQAILKVTNWNDAKDFVQYVVPMPEITSLNKGMNIMQSEGSYITYLKKYLLVNAFLIMEKSTAEQLAPEQDDPERQQTPVKTGSDCVVPHPISKALQRISSKKDVPINAETVYAHVNWRQISDEEKQACQDYINKMEA